MSARLIFIATTIWRMICLFLFPSSLQKRVIELDNQRCYTFEFKEPGLPLIICFAGLGDQFEFKKTLSTYYVNVIYVRDLSHRWYLKELNGIGNNVLENKSFFALEISRMKPSHLITIGASAGGFGAVLYGSLLNADSIVAFSPQTFRMKWLCLCTWDYRWLDRMVDIYDGAGVSRKYLDLKALTAAFKGKLILYYDRTNRLDNIHGARIKGKQVTHATYDFGGHNLVQILKQKGLLVNIMEQNLGVYIS